jgi:hypothetical protein
MGWTIASGTSNARFFVVLFALAVTIALGYLKFVRLRQPAAVEASATTATPVAGVGELEARVAGLEVRLAAAASAFGSERESGRPS